MKVLTDQTVVLYINEDEIVVRHDGTVVAGVRAELSQRQPSVALCEATPRDREATCNVHFIERVIAIEAPQ